MNAPAIPSDPGSKTILERRISEYARAQHQTEGRVRVTISQVIVAQMIPDALVKGGSGMKFRFGMKFARDSKDLDAAWRGEQEDFAAGLRHRLSKGWGPFAGTVKTLPLRHDERAGYPAMQPYAVKLAAYRRDFQTVVVEVGWDELGATHDGSAELIDLAEIAEMFAGLGLPRPDPVRVIAVHHQIAQKIHACTEPGNDRAHDLVDLQLLWPESEADLDLVAATAWRQFQWRQRQPFPGVFDPAPGWEDKYLEAASGLGVLGSPTDAASWLRMRLADLASRNHR